MVDCVQGGLPRQLFFWGISEAYEASIEYLGRNKGDDKAVEAHLAKLHQIEVPYAIFSLAAAIVVCRDHGIPKKVVPLLAQIVYGTAQRESAYVAIGRSKTEPSMGMTQVQLKRYSSREWATVLSPWQGLVRPWYAAWYTAEEYARLMAGSNVSLARFATWWTGYPKDLPNLERIFKGARLYDSAPRVTRDDWAWGPVRKTCAQLFPETANAYERSRGDANLVSVLQSEPDIVGALPAVVELISAVTREAHVGLD